VRQKLKHEPSKQYLAFKDPVAVQAVDGVQIGIKDVGHLSRVDVLIELLV